MLGFQDIGALAAFLLTIGAALVCVVYGIINWNKPSPDEEAKEIAEELDWENHDPDLKVGNAGLATKKAKGGK